MSSLLSMVRMAMRAAGSFPSSPGIYGSRNALFNVDADLLWTWPSLVLPDPAAHAAVRSPDNSNNSKAIYITGKYCKSHKNNCFNSNVFVPILEIDRQKGRPGAVVRAISLSHQVMGSKQPL